MKYITYAQNFNQSKNTPKVVAWIETVLEKYLRSNVEKQDEIEHIIDFLSQTTKDIKGMSYEHAKENAEAWSKAQQKKGRGIKETENDTEVVLDFKDGFKIVKLIGENAYKREGAIMGHCVASYYGNGKTIYSLRDNNNIPHCTMEDGQQVKGRGNGDVVDKYVDYVVKFLEHTGMTVGDNEMKHLGYVNVENIKDKNAVFPNLYKGKYFPKKDVEKINDKYGKRYESITLWDTFELFDFTADLKVNMHFSIENSVATFRKIFEGKIFNKNKGSSNEVAMASSNNVAMTSSNNVAMADSNIACGNSNNEVSFGMKTIVVLGNQSKVKGKIGSWFTLFERNSDGEITEAKLSKIDGKKIKEDTWYTLKDGKIIEVK